MYISVFQTFENVESELQLLRQALMRSKAEVQSLAAENAALKKEVASKEQSLEKERRKRLPNPEVPLTTAELGNIQKEELLRQIIDWDRSYHKMAHFFRDKYNHDIEKCKKKFFKMKHSLRQKISDIDSQWRAELLEKEKYINELEGEVQQVTLKNKKLKEALKNKKKALVECRAKLTEKPEPPINKKNAEWRKQCEALQLQLKEVTEKKEAYLQVAHELQRDHQRLEEKWVLKEQRMKEDMEVLKQENHKLQVCLIS